MSSTPGFIIVGENIHCSRKVKRGGNRTTKTEDGREAISFMSPTGTPRALPIPEAWTKEGAPPLVAHVRCAVALALDGDGDGAALASEFVQYEAKRQVNAGAHFIDVNVDEVSNDIDKRNEAMRWVVSAVQEVSDRPLSVDSSSIDTLRIGLEAYDAGRSGRPMLNSVSLERPEAIDLAVEHRCHVVVLPVSESGMPCGVEDRLANIDALVEKLTGADVAIEDLYVDPLVLAASTDPAAPQNVLETIRQVRSRYPGIHVAGGHTNISHGLPMRRLLNAVWIALAMEAGSDAGILDPISICPSELASLDRDGESFKMAEAGLLGRDEFFIDFITAAREGKLEDPWG
ncbi:MAG: dihydropteroate synthase [Phycisphaerae bacterium]|nr:dihydropteroate synthase [Phycisphaerae bacterium]